jgi:pimeloyl-ACP methyl ester carboxylesterase
MVWHTWGQATRRPELAPLVLLHGGSGSWMHWLRNIPALVDSGRWVLVPDLPGFGDSAVPAGGSDADALPEPMEQGLNMLVGALPATWWAFHLAAWWPALLPSALRPALRAWCWWARPAWAWRLKRRYACAPGGISPTTVSATRSIATTSPP